uniref:Barwin domain-containing protein n=1 Tax=Kwoniella pini CBS 10737 TaxID=1296096 RepID=A0A1B9HSV0_9TREE|nr:uncharacterized protein I206_07578 [Kwoniella pini CBS 10737]OCF46345.1 hypothetical protein I206_07578 [Kwoniella pini CBS 10737]
MVVQSLITLALVASMGMALPQWGNWRAPATSSSSTSLVSSLPTAASLSTSVSQAGPASAVLPASTASSASVLPAEGSNSAEGAESHMITINNNCGGGTPMIAYAANRAGQAVQGSVTVNGMVDSGIAWMSGTKDNCGFDGTGCGFMEFTLANSIMNSGDYSLLTADLGNHDLRNVKRRIAKGKSGAQIDLSLENSSRWAELRAKQRAGQIADGNVEEEGFNDQAFMDLTDLQNEDFIYSL